MQEVVGRGACLFVFGGRQPAASGATYDGSEEITSLHDMHRLELATGRWEELACTGDIPSGRSYCAMALFPGSLSDHNLYLFGGMINDERYRDLYAFDTTSMVWTRLPDGPMEGRGGAGLCSAGGSLWVLAGFCGRPVGDVWEYVPESKEWKDHPEMTLALPRSIFACCSGVGGDGEVLTVFGGELVAAAGNEEAGVYTDEVLSIAVGHRGAAGGGGGGAATAVPVAGPVARSAGRVRPAARGWTSGCRVQYRDRDHGHDGYGTGIASTHTERRTRLGTRTGFAVFGGISKGRQGEPPGVRLGDLIILE